MVLGPGWVDLRIPRGRNRMSRAHVTAAAACVLLASLVVDARAGTEARPRSLTAVREIENRGDQPTVLVFDDGTRFQTTLFEVRVLGVLQSDRKAPYFVLEGRGCTACDANTTIYIHSPSDGPMRGEAKQRRFAYPGREIWYEDRKTLLYEARTFI